MTISSPSDLAPGQSSGPHGTSDIAPMRRCIALIAGANEVRESPYACIITRNGEVVAQTLNRVRRDHDITRHAELVAISLAQAALGTTSLHDCTLYSTVEPCPMCSYAVREARIPRVVYALRSPVMGGHSRWSILADEKLSTAIPEVFAPPPVIVGGVLAEEASAAMNAWNTVYWSAIKTRGLIEVADRATYAPARRWWDGVMAALRLRVIDRLWR